MKVNCRSRYKLFGRKRKGFSLIEVGVSLILVGIISTTILSVYDRNMESAIDSTLKMNAFSVAREKLEEILAYDKVEESVDYGTTEMPPYIEWTTKVVPFYDQWSESMWVKAISIADYYDTKGEVQTVELEKWISKISKKQMETIAKQKDIEVWQLEQQLKQGNYQPEGEETPFEQAPGDQDSPTEPPAEQDPANPQPEGRPKDNRLPNIPYKPNGEIDWEKLFEMLS